MAETWYSDEYHYPLHMTGYASTLPVDDPHDPVKALHEVVAEVTRKPVPKPAVRRIGFAPWDAEQ